MKNIILLTIQVYQKYVSLDTGFLHNAFPVRICRFTPTCSEFTYQAITRYGILYGSWLGLKRIIRCNPWNSGGFDPVPTRLR